MSDGPDVAPLDDLVRRYLDGTLDEDEAAALLATLREDPGALQKLAGQMAVDNLLQAVGRKDELSGRILQSIRMAAGSPDAGAFGDRMVERIQKEQQARNSSRWLRWALPVAALALAAAGLWMFGFAPRPLPAPEAGVTWQVREAAGEVLLVKDGRSAAAVPGMPVPPGATLRTGNNGRAVMGTSGEDSWGRMGGRAEVAVLASAGGPRLRLDGGWIEAHVAPQKPGRQLVVETPQARAIVVGTRFALAVRKQGTWLGVDEGIVQLVGTRDGRSADVGAGACATVDADLGMTLTNRLDVETIHHDRFLNRELDAFWTRVSPLNKRDRISYAAGKGPLTLIAGGPEVIVQLESAGDGRWLNVNRGMELESMPVAMGGRPVEMALQIPVILFGGKGGTEEFGAEVLDRTGSRLLRVGWRDRPDPGGGGRRVERFIQWGTEPEAILQEPSFDGRLINVLIEPSGYMACMVRPSVNAGAWSEVTGKVLPGSLETAVLRFYARTDGSDAAGIRAGVGDVMIRRLPGWPVGVPHE